MKWRMIVRIKFPGALKQNWFLKGSLIPINPDSWGSSTRFMGFLRDLLAMGLAWPCAPRFHYSSIWINQLRMKSWNARNHLKTVDLTSKKRKSSQQFANKILDNFWGFNIRIIYGNLKTGPNLFTFRCQQLWYVVILLSSKIDVTRTVGWHHFLLGLCPSTWHRSIWMVCIWMNLKSCSYQVPVFSWGQAYPIHHAPTLAMKGKSHHDGQQFHMEPQNPKTQLPVSFSLWIYR